MRQFRTVYMRGGTSKGLMFNRKDLPEDQALWDDIFLQCMGNPDPKQIDGMGGTVSSNNKIIIVSRSQRDDADVDYLVGQVVVGRNQVDYSANCGNMTSAVGPFAIEEGLIDRVTEPTTLVRQYNLNTRKRIDVEVPVRDGRLNNQGDCRIAGINGTAGEIKVNFLNPAGALTGRLLPTGHVKDLIDVDGLGQVEATILDVSGPLVIVRAADLGATGSEMPEAINADERLCARLEQIRARASVLCGLTATQEDATALKPSIPKIAMCAAPLSYRDMMGGEVRADTMDLCFRIMSVFKCHKASPLTSATACAVAAYLEGSVAAALARGLPQENKALRMGHPSGVMTVYPQMTREGDGFSVQGVAVQRTARRIMEGTIFIPR